MTFAVRGSKAGWTSVMVQMAMCAFCMTENHTSPDIHMYAIANTTIMQVNNHGLFKIFKSVKAVAFKSR